MSTYCGVGLSNPKTGFNVGSTLRACGCFGVSMLVTSGQRCKDFKALDVKGEHTKIPFFYGVDNLKDYIPYGCVPVAIELADDAIPLPEYQHPERAFYIFGPEDSSLGEKTYGWCRDKVYIPMNYCSNLAATVYMILYDRSMKQYLKQKR